tara:strand:+ start:339 stop:548 length:210 start_codon:yes stop_codon:yes gene_type:complete
MTKVYLNNELIDLTETEETKRLEEVAADKTAKDARIAAKTEANNKKASGKQKLKDLGLDDDEIKALIGA